MNSVEEILSGLSHLNLEGSITNRQQFASGFGASCDVYTAWSSKHKKKVAIKQIRYFMAKDKAFCKRLAKEIRIWTALDNENVLPLLGYIVEGELKAPSLVSEWMEKGTLHEFMGTFPQSSIQTCTMLFGIASGLAYLHSKAIIHADLKSQNVLISAHNSPLLADFGVSVVLNQSTSSSIHTRGTVRWVAKELLLPSNDSVPNYNEQTDIWALGMVAYELLSLNVPYSNIKADYLVVMAIISGELPERPSECGDLRIFDGLWKLCLSCWADLPSRPPASTCMKTISFVEAVADNEEKSSWIEPPVLSLSDSIPLFERPESRNYRVRDTNAEYSTLDSFDISTNDTAFDPSVPSRILGILSDVLAESSRNFGASLGRLAGRVGLGKYAKAKKTLKDPKYWRFRDWTPTQRQDICEVLMGYARLRSRTVQSLTFQVIVRGISEYPPLRQVFLNCKKAQLGSLNDEILSWRSPLVDYGPRWLYLYDLVFRCLSDGPVVDIVMQFDPEKRQLHFLDLAKLFSCCRELSEASLALEFAITSWDGSGLDTYLIRNRYNTNAFSHVIRSVRHRYQIANSHNSG